MAQARQAMRREAQNPGMPPRDGRGPVWRGWESGMGCGVGVDPRGPWIGEQGRMALRIAEGHAGCKELWVLDPCRGAARIGPRGRAGVEVHAAEAFGPEHARLALEFGRRPRRIATFSVDSITSRGYWSI